MKVVLVVPQTISFLSLHLELHLFEDLSKKKKLEKKKKSNYWACGVFSAETDQHQNSSFTQEPRQRKITTTFPDFLDSRVEQNTATTQSNPRLQWSISIPHPPRIKPPKKISGAPQPLKVLSDNSLRRRDKKLVLTQSKTESLRIVFVFFILFLSWSLRKHTIFWYCHRDVSCRRLPNPPQCLNCGLPDSAGLLLAIFYALNLLRPLVKSSFPQGEQNTMHSEHHRGSFLSTIVCCLHVYWFSSCK